MYQHIKALLNQNHDDLTKLAYSTTTYQAIFFQHGQVPEAHGAEQVEDLGQRGALGDGIGTWIHEDGQVLIYKAYNMRRRDEI